MNFCGAAELKQTAILLYGKPASGKTTARKYLQALSPLGLLLISFDLFSDQLPMSFGRDKAKRGISDDLVYFPQYDKYIKSKFQEGKFEIDMPNYDNPSEG